MKAMRDVWGDTLVAVRKIESKRAGLGRRPWQTQPRQTNLLRLVRKDFFRWALPNRT